MRLSDAVAHLLGGQAVVAPDDRHDWDIDFRQHINRCAHDREWCREQDEDCHHNKCVRPL